VLQPFLEEFGTRDATRIRGDDDRLLQAKGDEVLKGYRAGE